MELKATAPAAVPVQVRTLGRFAVEVGGQPLALGVKARRRPLEVLKLLIALGGRDVPARALVDALWPDSDGDAAQGTLHTNLHRLRELIGRDPLRLEQGRLSLDVAVCSVDALQLPELWHRAGTALDAGDEAAAWAAAEAAMGCYGGPFLDGDEEPAEVLVARERLHRLHLRVVGQAAQAWATRGATARAVALYEHGLGLDDTAEPLYQGLLRCLQRAGRAAEARAVYERCQSLLAMRLGRAPAPETQAILRESAAGVALPEAEPAERPTAIAAPVAAAEVRGQRRRMLAAAAVLLVLATVGAGWLAWSQFPGGRVAGVAQTAETGAPALPEQPSIAVLAFANLSGDPAEESFSDGLSDTLITRLAGLSDLLVIARSSSFVYKGRSVDVRQVGRELGVRHVLEGSVLVANGRVRIAAQLIEAATGRHVWADQYDREQQDVFAVMDEIAQAIVTEMAVKLTRGEQARMIFRATNNVQALRLYLQAQAYNHLFRRDANLRSRELAEAALSADADYASAVNLVGWTYMLEAAYGWSADPAASYRQAEVHARRALALDSRNPSAHVLLSRVHVVQGAYDQAVAAGRKAVEVAPNDADAVGQLSHLLVYAGLATESLVLVHKALRLEPYPRIYLLYFAGDSHYFAGDYAAAIGWYRRFLERQSKGRIAQFCWQTLISAHVRLGQLDEARRAVQAMLAVHPDFTVAAAVQNLQRLPFRDHAFLAQQAADLRAAGLPD